MAEQDDTEESFGLAQQTFKKALVDLLYERDFERISTSDIVKRSKCCRSSFYYHYTDKYDFAEKIADHEVQEFAQQLVTFSSERGPTVEERILSSSAISVADYVYRERQIYTLILDSRFPTMSLDDFILRLEKKLEQLYPFDVIAVEPSLDPHLYMYVEVYECMIFFKYWRNTDYAFSPKEFAQRLAAHLSKRAECFDIFLTGMKKQTVR